MKDFARMTKTEQRQKLARDIDAFFQAGNEVEELPPTATTAKAVKKSRRFKVRWQPLEQNSTETAFTRAPNAEEAVARVQNDIPEDAIIVDCVPAS